LSIVGEDSAAIMSPQPTVGNFVRRLVWCKIPTLTLDREDEYLAPIGYTNTQRSSLPAQHSGLNEYSSEPGLDRSAIRPSPATVSVSMTNIITYL
jgi:hypothetical protein